MRNTTKKGLIVALGILCGVGFSLEPWRLGLDEARTARQSGKEADAYERQMMLDQQAVDRLGNSLGKEEQIRGMGYHRPNERPIGP